MALSFSSYSARPIAPGTPHGINGSFMGRRGARATARQRSVDQALAFGGELFQVGQVERGEDARPPRFERWLRADVARALGRPRSALPGCRSLARLSGRQILRYDRAPPWAATLQREHWNGQPTYVGDLAPRQHDARRGLQVVHTRPHCEDCDRSRMTSFTGDGRGAQRLGALLESPPDFTAGVGGMQGILIDQRSTTMTAGADPRRAGYAVPW